MKLKVIAPIYWLTTCWVDILLIENPYLYIRGIKYNKYNIKYIYKRHIIYLPRYLEKD